MDTLKVRMSRIQGLAMSKRIKSTRVAMSRRGALQVGAGMFGLSLPAYLKAARAGGVHDARNDVSCIFLFLAGGISHFESWDPKPDAPSGIRAAPRTTALWCGTLDSGTRASA